MVEIIEIRAEENFIYFRAAGEVLKGSAAVSNLMRQGRLIVAACEAHGHFKVLLDARELGGMEKINSSQEHGFGKFLAIIFSYRYKVVFLLKEGLEGEGLVVGDLAETTAVNRGGRVRIFYDCDAAEAWLVG